MKILLIGAGGREHALAWKMSQSKMCDELFIAPGNAGTELCGQNISIDGKDFSAIKQFVLEKNIGLVVVGPEEPLVHGIVDFFLNDAALAAVPVIGPCKEGAKLEGSKDFAKEFMRRNNIPTAKYLTVTKENLSEGIKFLSSLRAPYVLKADGLAAGKGVIIPATLEEAKEELTDILSNERFGEASRKVVIEEFLPGIECSVFVISDDETYKILPVAKDYKRIGENDSGPNTGGMGAVSPVPFADETFMRKVEERIIRPTVGGLKKENIRYRGFIFIGLMNVSGDPFVIEYNVRMGDPETEVVIPRIKSDLCALLYAAGTQALETQIIETDPRFAVTVMMVNGGYPGDYEKGNEIFIQQKNDALIFHAGTKSSDGKLVTNGGRVLSITSFGKTIEEARMNSYAQIDAISFEANYYRRDIGGDLI